jgi:hypothetical protein
VISDAIALLIHRHPGIVTLEILEVCNAAHALRRTDLDGARAMMRGLASQVPIESRCRYLRLVDEPEQGVL